MLATEVEPTSARCEVFLVDERTSALETPRGLRVRSDIRRGVAVSLQLELQEIANQFSQTDLFTPISF